MEIFKLFGSIGVKGAKETEEEIDGVTAAAKKAGDESKGSFGKLSASMDAARPASFALLGAVTAVTAAIGAIGVAATIQAGELEQNLGGSEAIYGEYAAGLQETAKEAFSNMGLSTSDYLATVNKMGSLFRGAGFETKDALDMSSAAMQRAADVASIMGIDSSWAMESIAGAAKGNFTMMDNLGVAMNDTTLNAYALEKGIGKTTDQMTSAEKVGLAMEMFLDRTSYAAGNYAKENETFAGSLQTLKAGFANTAAEIGARFLPAATDVFNKISGFLLNDPLGQLAKLEPVFYVIGGAIAIGLLPALTAMAGAAWAAIAPLLPFLAVGAALGGIIWLLVDALGGWDATMGLLSETFNSVMEFLEPFITMIQENLMKAIEAAQPYIEKMKDSFSQFGDVLTVVGAIVGAAAALVGGILLGVINGIMGAISGLTQLISGIVAIVMNVFSLIVGIFTGDGEKIKAAVAGIGQGIVDVFGGLWNAVVGFLTGFVDGVVEFFAGLWDTLVGNSIVPDMINGIVQWFADLVNMVVSPLTDFVSGVVEKFEAIKTTVTTIVNDVKSAIGSAFESAKSTALDIFEGIKSGIEEKIEGAKTIVKNVIDAIKGFFNFSWSLPKLKLPHVSISGSFSLAPPSIPSFGISWYAKGGIMEKPTMFDFDPTTMRAKVGGEAGDEAIAPIETLLGYVRTAVAEQTGNMGEQLAMIRELLEDLLPQLTTMQMVTDTGALVGEIAPMVDSKLGDIAKRKGRGNR